MSTAIILVIFWTLLLLSYYSLCSLIVLVLPPPVTPDLDSCLTRAHPLHFPHSDLPECGERVACHGAALDGNSPRILTWRIPAWKLAAYVNGAVGRVRVACIRCGEVKRPTGSGNSRAWNPAWGTTDSIYKLA